MLKETETYNINKGETPEFIKNRLDSTREKRDDYHSWMDHTKRGLFYRRKWLESDEKLSKLEQNNERMDELLGAEGFEEVEELFPETDLTISISSILIAVANFIPGTFEQSAFDHVVGYDYNEERELEDEERKILLKYCLDHGILHFDREWRGKNIYTADPRIRITMERLDERTDE